MSRELFRGEPLKGTSLRLHTRGRPLGCRCVGFCVGFSFFDDILNFIRVIKKMQKGIKDSNHTCDILTEIGTVSSTVGIFSGQCFVTSIYLLNFCQQH